jgi:hypothetical protein
MLVVVLLESKRVVSWTMVAWGSSMATWWAAMAVDVAVVVVVGCVCV